MKEIMTIIAMTTTIVIAKAAAVGFAGERIGVFGVGGRGLEVLDSTVSVVDIVGLEVERNSKEIPGSRISVVDIDGLRVEVTSVLVSKSTVVGISDVGEEIF